MKLFILGKIYKLELESKGRTAFFTAEILEEDDTHFKFKDKYGKELTKSKDQIKSSEMVE